MPYKKKDYYLDNHFNSKIFNERSKLKKLLNLAKENRYSVRELSKIFKCCKGAIFAILYKNKITIKNLGRFKRKHTYNDEFFRNINIISSYWAGFIAADGCLYKRGNRKILFIALNQRDKQHILNFLRAIKSNIIPSKIKSNNSVGFSISSDKFFDYLFKLGITPNKSLTIKKVYIPSRLISHFIRGVFDGDGSISGRDASHIQLCIAGNKPFLEFIQGYLIKRCNINKVKIYPLKGKAHRLQYTGTQILKILDFLYRGSKENTRLKRKYDKYIKFKYRFKVNNNKIN